MTILLIEDNRLFSEMMELTLTEVDLHVVETLAAAKTWLKMFRADMILVDLGLPDSQGLLTLKELMNVKVPKVVLTVTPGELEEVAKLGACDYIVKSRVPEMMTRIRFHTNRLTKRPRFKPEVFEKIRECLMSPQLAS